MTHGDLFRQMGISRMEFATGPGNRIAVSGETNNLDAYMKIYNSPATAGAMAFDGVKRETVQMFVLDKELKMSDRASIALGRSHSPPDRTLLLIGRNVVATDGRPRHGTSAFA